MAILPADPGKLRPLASIYDALQNDEWLGNIIRWRSRSSLPGERAYTLEEMYKTFDELIKENDSAPLSTAALVGNGNRAAQRSEESSIQTGGGVEPAETVSANTNSVPETDSQPQKSDQNIREDEAL